MNEIENFYHNRVAINTQIAQDSRQVKAGPREARPYTSESRTIEDIVSISAEARKRLETQRSQDGDVEPKPLPVRRRSGDVSPNDPLFTSGGFNPEIFDRIDADDDGVVTLREFTKLLDDKNIGGDRRDSLIEWFKSAELEADGTEGLTKREAVRYYEAAQGGTGEAVDDLSKLFSKFDMDKNGVVTLREFTEVIDQQGVSDEKRAQMIEWFKAVQAEADGQDGITKAETERLFNIADGGKDADFYYYDANNDGVVSKRELIHMAKNNGADARELLEILGEADTDGNGSVTLAEYQRYVEENTASTEDGPTLAAIDLLPKTDLPSSEEVDGVLQAGDQISGNVRKIS